MHCPAEILLVHLGQIMADITLLESGTLLFGSSNMD